MLALNSNLIDFHHQMAGVEKKTPEFLVPCARKIIEKYDDEIVEADGARVPVSVE